MSGEKIDLAKVIDPEARKEARWVIVQREHALALVAAVRAAMRVRAGGAQDLDDLVELVGYLDAALSPFTDSAESASGVRSDA